MVSVLPIRQLGHVGKILFCISRRPLTMAMCVESSPQTSSSEIQALLFGKVTLQQLPPHTPTHPCRFAPLGPCLFIHTKFTERVVALVARRVLPREAERRCPVRSRPRAGVVHHDDAALHGVVPARRLEGPEVRRAQGLHCGRDGGRGQCVCVRVSKRE